ncbi:hypothetical protein BY458DRAFT_494213 [Sporodiniella umbellata]|nr:hypothetical protein BY458DRAFT_494213 [Sporodiniella umbellata]
MTKSKNKCLKCRQFIIQNCKNYNFPSRSDSESAFKKTLVSVEQKALNNANIDTFWGKKNAQYKTLQAAYVQRQLQSSVSFDVDESTLTALNQNSTRLSEKRRFDASEEESRKKTKVEKKKNEDKKKEDDKKIKDRNYVLDFMEINAVNAAELKIHKTKKNLSVEERLQMVGCQGQRGDIFTATCSYKQRRNGNRQYSVDLVFIRQGINKKNRKICSTQYSQSEIDFIIKFASVLVQNAFSSSKKSPLIEEVSKEYLTTRPDIIIICHEGIEVGCGEVKPPKKSKELIDTDRARIAEICKRQLYLRLKKSSCTKEHCAFGILIGEIGMMLELTKLEFDNGIYNYSILKTIEIPGRKKAYDSIEKTFESLYSFTQMIEQSLPSEKEKLSSLLFDQYSDILKPTIRFLK